MKKETLWKKETSWEVVFFREPGNWDTREWLGDHETLDEAYRDAEIQRGYCSEEADQIRIVEVTRTVV